MNLKRPLSWLIASALAQAVLPAVATAANITREFTAAWYDPSRSGHGLGLEVIEGAAGKTALAYWFTYDTDGKQMWLYGTGTVVGDRASMTVFKTRGGAYNGSFTPAQVVQEAWGSLELSFSDCNTGQLRYTPNAAGAAAGTMPLSRLTQLFNGNCTGGVSDDRQVGSAESELITFLTRVGAPAAASAKAKFEERTDRTEFSVELEDLPIGDYRLAVGGRDRGVIRVTAGAAGNRGELEFRSPVEPGKILLDFDPRGAGIQVYQQTALQFEGSLNSGAVPPPGTTPPPIGGVPTGNARYDLVIEPSGSDGPELHAKLEQRPDRVDFSVELEDVAVGSYDLQIGGSSRGSVTVVNVTGGTEGELEFRNPVESGKLLLNFDPRGQQIRAVGPAGTVLSGMFPTTPTGTLGGSSGGDDDGDDCDDTGDDDSCDDNGGGDDSGGSGGTTPTPGVASTALTSTGIDADANGSASYESTASESEFEVEVEDLDDGSYQLLVGGVSKATIQVSGSEGEVKFNRPTRAGRLLLDFDPRGARIEIAKNGVVYLSGTL